MQSSHNKERALSALRHLLKAAKDFGAAFRELSEDNLCQPIDPEPRKDKEHEKK